MAAIKALEQWCKAQCEGYQNLSITNMTSSFRSGLAFCALIHKYRPDLIDYDSLRKEDVFENNRLAFQVAEEKLGIPALLDAEDMVALRIPDRLSILTYVSQYYNYFKGRPPVGGVKRPAEGSKEEPSEKKNLPVVAKGFVSKTAIENSLLSSGAAPSSSKPVRAAVQKAALADSANKNGTLNSKCVLCKSHVHLVQRHFVDGKLYHRTCFKCEDCSGTLHTGGYKPGKTADTFVCKAHHKSELSSVEPGIKNAPFGVKTNGASQTNSAPKFSSVLTMPLNVTPKPVGTLSSSQSWTTSAQKTQAARQRFFNNTAPGTEASAGDRRPAELSKPPPKPKISQSPDDQTEVRIIIGKKLAEANFNNNNKRMFVIRSAERRFGDEPTLANSLGERRSQGAVGSWAGQLLSRQANNEEMPCIKTIKDDTRPTTSKGLNYKRGTDPPKTEEAQKDAEALPVQQTPRSTCTPASTASISTRSPSVPMTPFGSFAPLNPKHTLKVSPEKPPSATSSSVSDSKPGPRSSMKSPPRQPAPDSAAAPPSYINHTSQYAAKKGKYLSPTNASRTEMRSPSVKLRHIPMEQIERELNDIEASLVHLEKEGVVLEKRLRTCEEEGDGDMLMDPLMVDWFDLIRKKQLYIRRESELVYLVRTQELEQQQPEVERELRGLLEKPDHLKSREERQHEGKLLQRLMQIVDGRNAIVQGLDEDRLREVEEDQQLNTMMQNLGLKKGKNKRKSSISRLFGRKSKRRVECH